MSAQVSGPIREQLRIASIKRLIINDENITALDNRAILEELLEMDRDLNHFPPELNALSLEEKQEWFHKLCGRRAGLLEEVLRRMKK